MCRPIFLALLLVPALLAASAHAALRVGIADQKVDMFSDPRFQALGLHDARLQVPWDVMGVRWERAQVDTWLRAARRAGIDPLVTFDKSLVTRRRKVLPTVAVFRAGFVAFRRRYPWVHTFATWNEANYCGQKTCHKPALVAAYYRAIRHACPRCTILAAEVLDMYTMIPWVRAFRRAAHVEPRYWGLHDYSDVNRLQTLGTRALLRATRGQVWLTETGGLVSRHNHSRVRFEQSVPHAARALRFLFDRIARLSPRISRVYIYQWNVNSFHTTWDSALVGPGGVARPGLGVLQRAVTAGRAR